MRPRHPRVLAVAPSTRGFGFAILEGPETLADWGVKSVRGDKNASSLQHVGLLIDHYKPDLVVLENHTHCRRAARIRALIDQISTLAKGRKIRVLLFSQEQIRRAFLPNGRGTKHAIAEIVAKRFSEELGSRLPPKRRPWMSEDYRMDIFDAVALALAVRLRSQALRPLN
jgi:Holliday junction resolvasome RuvABC endonuclease subunit